MPFSVFPQTKLASLNCLSCKTQINLMCNYMEQTETDKKMKNSEIYQSKEIHTHISTNMFCLQFDN